MQNEKNSYKTQKPAKVKMCENKKRIIKYNNIKILSENLRVKRRDKSKWIRHIYNITI